TSHEVVVEMRGKGTLNGSRGNAWLAYQPAPQATQDLAGDWLGTKDSLRYDIKLSLPGNWSGKAARRSVIIDKTQSGRNVILHTEGRFLGVMINGRWIRRHHHLIGDRMDLNITPWVKFGEENEIELVGDSRKALAISLNFYDKTVYP
ncbi:MAG: hypothetical protein WC637_17920, partial [Victivallales bacterium]